MLTLPRCKSLRSKKFPLEKATGLLECMYLEFHFLGWAANENFEGGNDAGADAGIGDLGPSSLSPEVLIGI